MLKQNKKYHENLVILVEFIIKYKILVIQRYDQFIKY